MFQAIMTAPCVEMRNLEHLFIELTASNCNLKCKHCYLEFDPYKKIKDFIAIEKIKKALYEVKNEPVKSIYLTGGEPMLHPHFNNILRLCLRKSSVTVLTNGMTINDKKARFLRKVEDETSNELIFKISIDHYDELENDKLRGRGSYRKVIFAIQSLVKYEFNPVLSIVNIYNTDEKELKADFKAAFAKMGLELEDINFSIIPFIDKNLETDEYVFEPECARLDCSASRVLTANGVYTCCFMTKDERGRSGADFTDYSKKNYVETSICHQCASFGRHLLVNSWM